MKTFIKILVGFILGGAAMFIGIAGLFGYIEDNKDDERLLRTKEKIADYTRNLGYVVKVKNEETKAEFKFGFH